MKILKNKHVLTAALVAPLLALMSYFAIDFFMGEPPHAAEEGQSYKLVEKPNCRYNSGQCGLKNVDFELGLSPEWSSDDQLVLTLQSEIPLDGVVIALVQNEADDKLPVDMLRSGDDGLVWTVNMGRANPEQDRLRLVAAANQSLWYGDVALKFALPKTE
jgi:hypothetical protein